MIILPTIYRPQNLIRFINAYRLTGATLPVYVVLDGANAHTYNHIITPPHWFRCSVPPGTRIGEIFNLMFNHYPDEPYYSILADDVVPETNIWDIILRDSCLPDKIAWGFDGGHDETLPRHPFIGGELARKLGFLAAPGIKHWFVDNAWREIAKALDCGVYLPQVKMIHKHPINGSAMTDRTYDNQPNHTADQYAYVKFMNGEFHDAIKRVKGDIL